MTSNPGTLQPTRLRTHPHTTRSRVMLEVASELVSRKDWPFLQVRVSLHEQGSDDWPVNLFASDSPATVDEVASGKVQIAIINPSMVLKMAALGSGRFKEPLPLAAIAVLPSSDRIVFAVRREMKLTTVGEMGERRLPLRISLRQQADHSLHVVIHEVLAAAGFSLDDIISWGGEIRYDAGMPYGPNRLGALQRGEIDAIFDEGANAWGTMALELGMTFLELDEILLQRLEQIGLRRNVLDKARFPKLSRDVPTLDFSGWLIYARRDAPDPLITAFCSALEACKDRIPWAEEAPLPLDQMVRDSADGHLEVPFHPAAERFWRERGYLP
ncbi:MAG TPA: TAXI family TRAP transporter solute-binding subunit [Candidatus Binatia bacterium]|nr:TAXI family TRAP transporter solute-binding subunit [Candidatus Binatia bacterium]